MTEAMPFLRKLILLSYDPRPSAPFFFPECYCPMDEVSGSVLPPSMTIWVPVM